MEKEIEKLKSDIERLKEELKTPGSFIFELRKDTTIGFLTHYASPFTGGGQCIVPTGFKFVVHSTMRDDAFYMLPFENEPEKDESLISTMREISVKNTPEFANRITGFVFYITEKQLRSGILNFLRGDINILLELIEKQKAYTEYWKNPENQLKRLRESFSDGSFMKEYDECGVHKMLKERTETCPSCGYKLRPVFWGEITPEVLQQKKKGKIFIGEHLYGKDSGVDYKKEYGDYKCIKQYTRPNYACGNCGNSYILKKT